MSPRNESGNTKLWVRVLAFVLAGLMLLSVAYLAISFILSAFAAEDPLAAYALRTSQADNKFYVTAGVKYGTSVKKNYTLSSQFGLIVGVSDIPRTTDRSFTPLVDLGTAAVNIMSDENLTVTSSSCAPAASASATDIGAYHVELSRSSGDIWGDLASLRAKYSTVYGFVFPAYTEGERTVRVGAFATEKEAAAAKSALLSRGVGSLYTVTVVAPAKEGITVLTSDYSDILFEFRSADADKVIGLCAAQRAGEERAYLCNGDTGYLYDGVFSYRPYYTTDASGFSVINLVGLSEYIEGVLPTEFLNTWPLESQKAAAVTICCYTLSGIGKRYSSYGFDLTCSSYDQNYFGRRKVTQVCIDGASAVEGLAMTYKGSLITGYYCTSNGGWSVASNVAWVGTRGYLITHPTPWEDYIAPSIKNGTWEREFTPENVLTRITNYRAGLKGTKVSTLDYTTVSEDCPYVYSFTAKDNKGYSITIEHSSSVYGALNLLSPNFVIGKGSVNYYYDEVLETKVINLNSSSEEQLNVFTAAGRFLAPFINFNFRTKDGIATSDSSSLHIMTADGVVTVGQSGTLPKSTKPDKNGYYTSVCEFGDFAVVTKNRRHFDTLTAADPNNFVLYGKGSGHGVGMSQIGIYYLAVAGATYDQILRAYYNDVDFVNVFDYLQATAK